MVTLYYKTYWTVTTLTDIQLFSPTKRPTLWSNTQLFLRYFSVSSKVFYPVAYIMNGIQHLTTPTCLKFCLGIMLFIWPQFLKIWPQLSPVWPQLLSFGERDGDNFFTARANPANTMKRTSNSLPNGDLKKLVVRQNFFMTFSPFTNCYQMLISSAKVLHQSKSKKFFSITWHHISVPDFN